MPDSIRRFDVCSENREYSDGSPYLHVFRCRQENSADNTDNEDNTDSDIMTWADDGGANLD